MRFLPAYVGAAFMLASVGVMASDPKIDEDDLAAAGIALIHDDCARSFPELAGEWAPGYEAWRTRNREALSRLEANREYRERMKEDLERIERGKRPIDAAQRGQMREYCDGMLTAMFDGMPTTGPESPAAAWRGLIDALREGNARRALSYCTGGARGRYREVFKALGPEGMRKAAEDFRDIDKFETMGDSAFAYTSRLAKDGTRHAYEISFMRDRRTGGWYVDGM